MHEINEPRKCFAFFITFYLVCCNTHFQSAGNRNFVLACRKYCWIGLIQSCVKLGYMHLSILIVLLTPSLPCLPIRQSNDESQSAALFDRSQKCGQQKSQRKMWKGKLAQLAQSQLQLNEIYYQIVELEAWCEIKVIENHRLTRTNCWTRTRRTSTRSSAGAANRCSFLRAPSDTSKLVVFRLWLNWTRNSV